MTPRAPVTLPPFQRGCPLLEAALLLILLNLSGPARAEEPTIASPPPQKPQQPEAPELTYEVLVEEGVREFSHNNYQEARAFFSLAHSQQPTARTARSLGMVDFELRDYRSALGYLEEALQSQRRPLTAALRKDVEALAARCRALLVEVSVEVTPEEAEPSIRIDHELLPAPPLPPLLLQVGEHQLLVEAEGFQAHREVINLRGARKKLRLQVALQPIDLSTARPAATPRRPQTSAVAAMTTAHPLQDHRQASDTSSIWESPWLWTGVGTVLVASGVVLAILLAPQGDGPEAQPGDVGGVIKALTTAH